MPQKSKRKKILQEGNRERTEPRISFRNLTKHRISVSYLAAIGERALRVLGFYPWACVSVVFMDEKNMRTLNRQWRRQDAATTVLAFSFLEDFKHPPNGKGWYEIGEVVLCPSSIRRAQKKFGTFSDALAILFVHGIVHLAGFTHERSVKDAQRMKRFEQKILSGAIH